MVQKSRCCKECVRDVTKTRISCEKDCRLKCPHFSIPCFTCCCVTIKVIILQLIEPFIIPIACIAAIITFFMRLLRCPHGKDLVYSCLECFEVVDLAIGLYWEVDWWRKHERGEKHAPAEAV